MKKPTFSLGKLYKKDRLGEFKEKYFVLTKKLLLILDLLHKSKVFFQNAKKNSEICWKSLNLEKKMLIFELETLHLELSQAKSDKETLQIQAPHKVFFIKVGSKGFSAQFREKLSAHIALVRQNLTISEYNSRICATKAEFWRRVDAKIANSFANIEDLLYEYKFRKWFFKFIEEKSPEEGGLLVLTEIYVKFQRNLKEENFKEAFKNCNRIYEILKKISADWGKKKQDLLIVREKIEVLPDSPVVKTVKMFHTKSNLNSLANSEKKLRENPRNFKENRKFIKNSNKTPDNFVTKQQEKPQKTKIPRDNPLKNRKISSNFEENLEKNISFHQDFFTKIFKDFDWESCEKKFFYMKNVFLFDGVECQIRDLFANLFVKVVNYLQINYYNSFLNSKFYEKKLRFFQMKKARKKIFAFEKPSFLQKQLVFNNKGGESLENNEISCSKIAEKNVVSTLQMKEIKNLNYGQGNPYSIFSENERSSILNDYTSRFFSNNSKSNEIYEHP